MLRSYSARPSRSGFTLVELLVAAALCILVMTILATAFQSGLQTMSHLKSAVSLSEQLRAAEDALRRDLSAVHLEDEFGRPVPVSALQDYSGTSPVWASQPNRPRKGYFAIRQPSVPVQLFNPAVPTYDAMSGTLQPPGGPMPFYPYLAATGPFDLGTSAGLQNRANYPFLHEGSEDGVDSFRAHDQTISMTVKLSGQSIQNVFAGNYPAIRPQLGQPPFSRLDLDPSNGGQTISEWAEVVWFLRPIADPANGFTTDVVAPDDPNPEPRPKLQLYSLHRMQRVIPPLPMDLPFPTAPSPATANLYRESYPDLSIATVRPVGASANLNATGPTAPGYPLGYLGTSPWFDASVTSARVNTPETVTDPLNRSEYILDWLGFAANPGAPPQRAPLLPAGYQLTNPAPGTNGLIVNPNKVGSDLVLNNVVSMEIRVQYRNPNPGSQMFRFGHLNQSQNPQLSPPFLGGPPFFTQPMFYDSYYGGRVGGTTPNAFTNLGIQAVQLKLRIFDVKNNMTRQMTITQEL